ncbi:VTT domain-containing protein [Azospirillum sp. TSO22-1]|uniref:VTT domain-containing protein n=1 Tax=Azospirillum sp. TSO22-1 TaxID=716789 RepID=UPI000D641440|nr:VTT domain-containing protein [Azospirillum sp. TSO22-1]
MPTFLPFLAETSPAALLLGIALLTLLHEDVAIAAGAGLITTGTVDLSVAALALLGGIVAGDVMFYVLGTLSRRSDRLRTRMEGPAFRRCRAALERNLLLALLACRLVPGILMPTYVACGAMRISFARFALITVGSATLHAGGLLLLLTSSLEASAVEIQATGLLLVGVLVLARSGALARLRRPGEPATPAVRLPGMPLVPAGSGAIGLAERIWPPVFYIPLVVQWIALGIKHRSLTLPTVANPTIEAGGLLGESKIACLDMVRDPARRWVATSVPLTNDGRWTPDSLRELVAGAGLTFPLVLKPDIGWRGFGVRLVADADALLADLATFPADCALIVQAYVPYAGEAGVFYVRRPGEAHGFIFSMTFRYFPHVVGDGRSTLAELIERDPRAAWKADLHRVTLRDQLHEVPETGAIVRLHLVGSSRVGGLYKDARAYATPALTRRFDEIADAMPNFHFGRFDVRFASVERLMEGEDIQIIEVNGAGAEAIHVWDPDFKMVDVYADLFRQQALMFEIGALNRTRGFRPLSLRELAGFQQRQQRLLSVYPASN